MAKAIFPTEQARFECLRLITEGVDMQAAVAQVGGDVEEFMLVMEEGRQDALAMNLGNDVKVGAEWYVYCMVLVAKDEFNRRKVADYMPASMPAVIHDISTARIAELARQRDWSPGLTDYERFLLNAMSRAENGFSMQDVATTMGISADFAALREVVDIGQAACRAKICTALSRLAMDGDVKSAIAWLEATDDRFQQVKARDEPVKIEVVHRMTIAPPVSLPALDAR